VGGGGGFADAVACDCGGADAALDAGAGAALDADSGGALDAAAAGTPFTGLPPSSLPRRESRSLYCALFWSCNCCTWCCSSSTCPCSCCTCDCRSAIWLTSPTPPGACCWACCCSSRATRSARLEVCAPAPDATKAAAANAIAALMQKRRLLRVITNAYFAV